MAGLWTQADVDSIKAALSQGVLSVSYAGPPGRSVMYQSTGQMLQLLALMVADVADVAGTRSGYHLAAHRSGL